MSNTYQPNIPSGTVDLNQDYLNLLGNFQQLDTTFGIDHTLFSNNTAQNGYHTVIHMIPPLSTPRATPGYGELYNTVTNDGINTDTQLFFQTGMGFNVPLTRNFQPALFTGGNTFLPGGIILQWGQIISAFGTNTGTATFSRPFPTKLFNVQITMTGTSGSPNLVQFVSQISDVTPIVTGFNWQFTGGSTSSYTGFYWTAIGI
jgi:hypothetical protein